MSDASAQPNIKFPGALSALADKWGWIVALGVVFILAGAFALGAVVPATVASVLWVGVLMLMAGAAEVIAAFQFKDWGRFLMWLALGALYIAAGVMTFMNPLLAAVTLTLFLAFALIVGGVLRIALGLSMKENSGWGFVVFSGVMTLLLGVMLLAKWPVSGLYALGIFLGVDLMFAGFAWLATGMALRNQRNGALPTGGKTA